MPAPDSSPMPSLTLDPMRARGRLEDARSSPYGRASDARSARFPVSIRWAHAIFPSVSRDSASGRTPDPRQILRLLSPFLQKSYLRYHSPLDMRMIRRMIPSIVLTMILAAGRGTAKGSSLPKSLAFWLYFWLVYGLATTFGGEATGYRQFLDGVKR